MKWFNGYRMRLVFVGFVAAIVLSGGRAKADFTFGTPTNLGPTVNSSSLDSSPSISTDGLSLYFSSNRPGGSGDSDIWVTTRETINDDWSIPINLGSTVNSSAIDIEQCISADGLQLYFESRRPGSLSSKADIWVTTRSTTDDPWGEPVNLGSNVNSSGGDGQPSISSDGLELFFASSRAGNQLDLFVTTRVTINDNWDIPTNLGTLVNSSNHEWSPNISSDGLILLFTRGPELSGNIWMAKRKTVIDNWSAPVELDSPINSTFGEFPGNISADGRTLYFESNRLAGFFDWDIWQASIIPTVDFNGDGIVDSADMCIMIDHWGEDYSLCDIGPTPLGDGVVDVQDLIVLAEHLFEEVLPYGCVAYWKLDQTEGNIAHNSAGFNDGICHGEPLWQPTDGMIGGALQLDGTNDYVEADFVLSPADGAFSTFAWIKGGAPGQVIISQVDTLVGRTIKPGNTWLGVEPLNGKLMTGLGLTAAGSPIPPLPPLVSESVITDGQWHHVGIIVVAYQSMQFRYLYLDGVSVAMDIQLVKLPSLNGGLRIGAGNNLEAGTFFSGLIDDIRIYNKALSSEEIEALAR